MYTWKSFLVLFILFESRKERGKSTIFATEEGKNSFSGGSRQVSVLPGPPENKQTNKQFSP